MVCAHSVHQDRPLLTREPVSNLELNVDQDKRDLVWLNVKPAQFILDFHLMVHNALDAQLIKLFHQWVSAQSAQLDKKLMLVETDVMLSELNVDQELEEFHTLNAESVIFTPEFLLMAFPALVAWLIRLLILMETAQTAQMVKLPMTAENVSSLLFHVAQENTESPKPNAKLVLHTPRFLLMEHHALDAQPVNLLIKTDTAQCAHHNMLLKIKEFAYQ